LLARRASTGFEVPSRSIRVASLSHEPPETTPISVIEFVLSFFSGRRPLLEKRSVPMSKVILFMTALVVVLSASARGEGLGIGIIAGNPTGVTAKKWFDSGNAIDGAAAWSLGDHGAFQLHADYLWHWEIDPISYQTYGRMPLYVGVGGRVEFRDSNHKHHSRTGAGVRIPVGVLYLFENAPVEIFFEVAPTLDVAPSTDLDVGAAAGIRYYFR
jgi:hypothetical protein